MHTTLIKASGSFTDWISDQSDATAAAGHHVATTVIWLLIVVAIFKVKLQIAGTIGVIAVGAFITWIIEFDGIQFLASLFHGQTSGG